MNENLNENNNVNPPVAETVVETPVTGPTITVPLEPKKKKKGGFLKGLIIFLIVVLIIGGLIFGGIKLYKHLTTIEDPFPDIDSYGAVTETKPSFTDAIDADYANGVINKDQYLMQLAYSIFEPSKLDAKYSSLNNDYLNPNGLYEEFSKADVNELSAQTILYIYGKYIGNYIEWDPSLDTEDSNTSKVYNAEVKKVSNVNPQTLDKAKLSNKGNFIIYYDSTGSNAVSEEIVNLYAEFLEEHVDNYKKIYGLEYKYTQGYTGIIKTVGGQIATGRATAALLKSNIPVKYMDTAMPVYLLNMEELNAPAFYTGGSAPLDAQVQNYLEKICVDPHLFFDEGKVNPVQVTEEQLAIARAEFCSGALSYAFPYFVINSSITNVDDLKLLSAHELFHHYQHYICGDGEYTTCKSGKFTIETTADLAAAKIAKVDSVGTVITDHAYQVNTKKIFEYNIDDNPGEGYGAFVFAYNYANTIPDGLNIINKSSKYEHAINYLYSSANGKYKDVMLKTSENYLTLNYDNKQYLPYEKGNTWSLTYPAAHGDINVNHREKIKYSSMHYYYVDPSTLGESKIYFKAESGTPHEMTLLLFVKEDNKYKKVYSHNLDEKFVIKASDWTSYDEIAFSIVESSIENKEAHYNLETSVTIKDDVTVTPKSLGLKEPDQSKRKANTIMCYRIEDTEYFKTGYQVLINLDKDQNIDNMLMKGTIKVSDNALATKALDIAKKTAPGLLLAMRLKYQQMLKNVRITTSETHDSWTVLFKVTKDYDGAFTSTFGAAGNSKEEIINTIKAKGFTCE
jgi:hypothetical protein